MADDWLDADQAMARLGVRPQTLYAYVSRGRIEAHAHPDDPRRSLYRASDVAALAGRKARGRKAADVAAAAIAWGEPVLASAITTVRGGRLWYRGRDAAELAGTESFEAVGRLLRDDAAEAAIPTHAPSDAPTIRARLFSDLAARAGEDRPARGRAPLMLAQEAAGLLDLVADAVAARPGKA